MHTVHIVSSWKSWCTLFCVHIVSSWKNSQLRSVCSQELFQFPWSQELLNMAHIVSKYCTQLSQSQDLSLTHCPHSLKISYTLFTHLIAVTYCTSSLKISYSYTLFMQSHIWTHCSHSLKFSYTLLTLGHNISHILFTVSRYFSGCSVSTSQTQWHCSQYQNISHTLFTQSVSLNISHTVHAISRSFTIFTVLRSLLVLH